MDTNEMLINDTKWLVVQGSRKVGEFLDVASKIDLRQEDWTRFWRELTENRNARRHQVNINGKDYELTDEELKFVDRVFGYSESKDNKIIFSNK